MMSDLVNIHLNHEVLRMTKEGEKELLKLQIRPSIVG